MNAPRLYLDSFCAAHFSNGLASRVTLTQLSRERFARVCYTEVGLLLIYIFIVVRDFVKLRLKWIILRLEPRQQHKFGRKNTILHTEEVRMYKLVINVTGLYKQWRECDGIRETEKAFSFYC